tara:strand:- start:1093 stop:2400 length:1308 start_codon:yes stop_codon:yes gene_type:complete
MQSGNTNSTNNPWTFSVWIKRAKVGAEQTLIMSYTDSNDFGLIRFGSDDTLLIGDYVNGSYVMKYETNRKFRDVSAWYHIVVSQSAVSGASPATLLYVNGVQETSFGTSNAYSQNDTQNWQKNGENFNFMMGQGEHYQQAYVCEAVWIDNTVYAASDFGEFDEDSGIWKPKDPSGLNFGTNGFYFDFADSGNLGDNEAGNSRADFSENNIAAVDQSTDTCTNNFATMNPLDNFYQNQTFSEGNLKILHDNPSPVFSTIGVSSGKWYMEAKAISGNNDYQIGICSTQVTTNSDEIGLRANDWGYKASDGKYKNNGSDNSYGSTYANGNIIGVYLDLDNNKLYFAKNGTIQNSGTGISITAPGSTPLGVYFFALGANAANTKYTWEVNFGNPTYTGTDQTDANGYGSFEYDPSSGTFDSASKDFYALNTKNLAEYGG